MGPYSLLRTLRAVLRTALTTVLHTLGIQGAANDVVTHTGKILHTAAADHHDGVFLQVVAFTRNVARHFEAIGQAHARNLTERGVRLLRGGGVDAGANTTLLRAFLQSRNLIASHDGFARLADQLVNRRHTSFLFAKSRPSHKKTIGERLGGPRRSIGCLCADPNGVRMSIKKSFAGAAFRLDPYHQIRERAG